MRNMTRHFLSFGGLTLGAMLLLAKTPPQFRVCDGTYALCTTATCKDKGGSFFSCTCNVMEGLSAGGYSQECLYVPKVKPAEGVWIPSRYYPIKSYLECPIKGEKPRAWAFCLDSPCVIEKGKTTADCICGKSNMAPYVYVTDTYSPAGCESENISSATVAGVEAITQFLSTSPLKPLTITVLPPPPPPVQ